MFTLKKSKFIDLLFAMLLILGNNLFIQMMKQFSSIFFYHILTEILFTRLMTNIKFYYFIGKIFI